MLRSNTQPTVWDAVSLVAYTSNVSRRDGICSRYVRIHIGFWLVIRGNRQVWYGVLYGFCGY